MIKFAVCYLAMWTPHLYDHKFDIDDIIRALCGDDHTGVWELCTTTGTLYPPQAHPRHPDGAANHHWHHVHPLPPYFLNQLRAAQPPLVGVELARLQQFLTQATTLNSCLDFFESGAAGGWLREQFKQQALLWLDTRGLIPPSMRHAWRAQAEAILLPPPPVATPRPLGQAVKIAFIDEGQ